jgi:hypothetical protein
VGGGSPIPFHPGAIRYYKEKGVKGLSFFFLEIFGKPQMRKRRLSSFKKGLSKPFARTCFL